VAEHYRRGTFKSCSSVNANPSSFRFRLTHRPLFLLFLLLICLSKDPMPIAAARAGEPEIPNKISYRLERLWKRKVKNVIFMKETTETQQSSDE